MAAPKGQIPPQLRPFVKGKGKATGKTSRISAAQAKALAARMGGKKMDAEDKKDGGSDEMKETANGKLKGRGVSNALDAEDKLDGGADEAQEDAQGNLKKPRTIADALSVNSRLKGKL